LPSKLQYAIPLSQKIPASPTAHSLPELLEAFVDPTRRTSIVFGLTIVLMFSTEYDVQRSLFNSKLGMKAKTCWQE
jgi:hypothetical protein